MKKRKENDNNRIITIVLLALIGLAVIFFISGGIGTKKAPEDKEAVERTAELLKSMENKEAKEAAPEKQNTESQSDQTSAADQSTLSQTAEAKSTAPSNEHPTDVNIDALREETLEHYGENDYNSQYFREWFEDAVIVGDSIAHEFTYYGWIYQSTVQAENGINVGIAYDLIQNTIYMQPKVVFLTYSANDVYKYQENIDLFISDYTADIQMLKDGIPGVRIYVQEILPCDPEMIYEMPYYEYLGAYNERLAGMCESMGAHLFSLNFLMEAHPEIYYEDGIHPNSLYAPLAMNYMAKIAGLDRKA